MKHLVVPLLRSALQRRLLLYYLSSCLFNNFSKFMSRVSSESVIFYYLFSVIIYVNGSFEELFVETASK